MSLCVSLSFSVCVSTVTRSGLPATPYKIDIDRLTCKKRIDQRKKRQKTE